MKSSKTILALLLTVLLASLCASATEAQWFTDPVRITTDFQGTPNSNARCTFWADGYYHVFYSNTTDLVRVYSANGSKWSDPIFVNADVEKSDDFAVAYLDSYWGKIVGFVIAEDDYNKPLNYTQGNLSGADITWGTEYVARAASSDISYSLPSLALDPLDGYPRISFSVDDGWDWEYHPAIVRCQSRDGSGTWYYTELATDVSKSYYTTCVALEGVVEYYIMYYHSNEQAYGKIQGGSEETVTTKTLPKNILAAVEDGEDEGVHIVYAHGEANGSRSIYYRKRDYNTSTWGTEELLVPATESIGGISLSIKHDTDEMYCIFIYKYSDDVAYLKYNGTAWDSSRTILYDRKTEDEPLQISASYHFDGDVISAVWREAGVSGLMFTALDERISDVFPTSTVAFVVATIGVGTTLAAWFYRRKSKPSRTSVIRLMELRTQLVS